MTGRTVDMEGGQGRHKACPYRSIGGDARVGAGRGRGTAVFGELRTAVVSGLWVETAWGVDTVG